MGGHDDDMSYAINKQKQDEELKNNLNDSGHWVDQESTGNNAKWVKEGRNQLRKVAKHQDHNCNINQNGNEEDFLLHKLSTEGEQQGVLGKSPKTAIIPDLNDEESSKVLIDSLEAPEEEEEEEQRKEEDDKEKEEEKSEEEEEEEEDESSVAEGERAVEEEQRSDTESQSEGAAVGRNTCLLFSNVSGTPSDEEASWPALSQEATDQAPDSTPNGNRGTPSVVPVLWTARPGVGVSLCRPAWGRAYCSR